MTLPSTDTSLPTGHKRAATLVLPRGAAHLVIKSCRSKDLVTGSFSGLQPEITSAGSSVFLRYPKGVGRTHGELRLNAGVEWTIQSGRGLERSTFDLTGLELRALRIAGGASRVRLNLPRTERRVHIEFDRGVDRVSIVRPPEIGAILRIGSGVSNLTFDNQDFAAISDGLHLESNKEDPTEGSYRITIRSGASRLSVGTSEQDAANPGASRSNV